MGTTPDQPNLSSSHSATRQAARQFAYTLNRPMFLFWQDKSPESKMQLEDSLDRKVFRKSCRNKKSEPWKKRTLNFEM
jgi:hypothetical protein